MNKLGEIVGKCNKVHHRTIKVKFTDVLPGTFIDYGINHCDRYPKFKVGDHARISKYINTFAKYYAQNWLEEVFVIKEIKNSVLWTYVISDLNGEIIVEKSYEKERKKTSQTELKVEKLIKRKGDR